ncbi:hypothetical protein ACFLZZ_02155 [Nanoarchaeota archaeon]
MMSKPRKALEKFLEGSSLTKEYVEKFSLRDHPVYLVVGKQQLYKGKGKVIEKFEISEALSDFTASSCLYSKLEDKRAATVYFRMVPGKTERAPDKYFVTKFVKKLVE